MVYVPAFEVMAGSMVSGVERTPLEVVLFDEKLKPTLLVELMAISER